MNKYRVIAEDNLEMEEHTWQKGLDYEVVEKGDYFTIASDQGALNYYNKVKESVLSHFKTVQ